MFSTMNVYCDARLLAGQIGNNEDSVGQLRFDMLVALSVSSSAGFAVHQVETDTDPEGWSPGTTQPGLVAFGERNGGRSRSPSASSVCTGA